MSVPIYQHLEYRVLLRPLAELLHLADCVLLLSSLALAMHVWAVSLWLTPLVPGP